MEPDENEFFRQATLRICSSLDIEKAMYNCLSYIQPFIPASDMSLSLLEPSSGVIRNLAMVTLTGSRKFFPPIPLSKEMIRQIESEEPELKRVRIINDPEQHLIASALRPYLDLTNLSFLTVMLAVEGERLGSLGLAARGKGRFTETHAHLISLLREPFSIAMSNALRYEEVVKLKDMMDAENRELSRELRHASGDEIVGAEYGLRYVMEMVRQVAPLASPVLLLGETGVGKEVIANAIHRSSPRRNAPFIKVNCGAIPENLLDSELFGHERGAFTGAVSQKRGRFERADKGSIFLDEIGELPPQAQVRLLRVLQYKEIERVGGTKTIPVDVRIIAATHRSMDEMIREKTFREDLWFRLNVFPITIPPLRHRRDDIAALVHHFLERKSSELKLYPTPSVSPEGVDRLRAYPWPGNVRELENLIERELIHTRGHRRGGALDFRHLGLLDASEGPPPQPAEARELETLDGAMAEHIRRALQLAGGKIYGHDGAAELLAVNPNTLRSRMRKLGVLFGKNAGLAFIQSQEHK